MNKLMLQSKMFIPIIFRQNISAQPKFMFSESHLDILKSFSEFSQAENYLKNKNYKLAEEYYNRLLTILQQVNLNNTNSYDYIINQMSQIALTQGNYQKIAQQQEQLLKKYKSQTNLDTNYYFKILTNNLLTQFNQNLNESKKVLKLMTSNKNILKSYKGQVHHFYAIQNMLEGDFENSEEQFKLALKHVQDKKLLWQIKNNQGVLTWLSQYPVFNKLCVSIDAYRKKVGSKEKGTKTINIFKESLKLLHQNTPANSNQYFQKLVTSKQVYTDLGKTAPQSMFTELGSEIPLMNICNFMIDAYDLEIKEFQLWSKYTLKFFEQKYPDHVYKPLMPLAIQCFIKGDFMRSEGLFRTIIQMLDDKNVNSIDKWLSKFYYGQMLKIIDKREKEGIALMEAALSEYLKYPKQQHYLQLLALPKYDFN